MKDKIKYISDDDLIDIQKQQDSKSLIEAIDEILRLRRILINAKTDAVW